MVIFDHFLDQKWAIFGPKMAQIWDPFLTSFSGHMGGFWPKSGQKRGPKMAQKVGPKMGPKMTHFGGPKNDPKTPDFALYLSPPRALCIIRGNPLGTPDPGLGP